MEEVWRALSIRPWNTKTEMGENASNDWIWNQAWVIQSNLGWYKENAKKKQRVGHDWMTELNWTELIKKMNNYKFSFNPDFYLQLSCKYILTIMVKIFSGKLIMLSKCLHLNLIFLLNMMYPLQVNVIVKLILGLTFLWMLKEKICLKKKEISSLRLLKNAAPQENCCKFCQNFCQKFCSVIYYCYPEY